MAALEAGEGAGLDGTVGRAIGGADGAPYVLPDEAPLEDRLQEREAQYRSIFESTRDGLVIADMEGHIVEVNPAFCAMSGHSRAELIGRHGTEITHPDSLRRVQDSLSAVAQGSELDFEALGLRRDGSSYPTEVHVSTFLFGGRPHMLAVIRDITERVRTRELLERRVEERTRELAALLSVSARVTSTLRLQPLLGLILDELKTVVDYAGASITAFEGEMGRDVAYRGPIDHVLPGPVYPAGDFALHEWVRRGETVIIEDVRHDTTAAAVAYRESCGDQIDTSYTHVTSHMIVPMAVGDRVIAALGLAHSERGFYTRHHAELAQAIANQAAIAMENARLYEQAQQVAVLEERQRLSRELHDSVSQALYSIALGARTARALLARDPARAGDSLDFVVTQSQRGLAEMRALILELRPEALEQEGLTGALSKHAAGLQARYQLEVEVALCPEPEVPLPVKEALYRIAQEALQNVVKHAHATRIRLTLSGDGDEIRLEIGDDGCGFDPSGSFPGHLGLSSMRERVERLGGTLEIESLVGHGTAVRACVPMERGRVSG